MQPDTIIYDVSNPQAWNRYSYVENRPINYLDSSGHFKCVNNSSNPSLIDNCHEVIEQWLTFLETQGGEEGKILVKAFREADGTGHCTRFGCPEKDQITIIIIDNPESDPNLQAQYATNGEGTFVVVASLMSHVPDEDDYHDLARAGVFGHEIDHMMHPYLSGTIRGEAHAYSIQKKLYENMGIASSEFFIDGNINNAMWLGGYGAKSEEERISRVIKVHPGMPFGLYEKLIQELQNAIIPDIPITVPSGINFIYPKHIK